MKTVSFDVWTALMIVRGSLPSTVRTFRLDEGRKIVYARPLSGNDWRDKATYERYLKVVKAAHPKIAEMFFPNWEDGQKWNGGNVGTINVRYLHLGPEEGWRWLFSDGWPQDKPYKHAMEGLRK